MVDVSETPFVFFAGEDSGEWSEIFSLLLASVGG